MMNDEFDFLSEEIPYQREFLEEWSIPRKGIVGGRSTGKTTTLLCELNRFNRAKIDTAWFSDSHMKTDYAIAAYFDLFGKSPIVDTYSVYDEGFRGKKYGALIIDTTDVFQRRERIKLRSLFQTQPTYVRAAVDENFEHENIYDMCDKVYEVDNSEIPWK